MSARVNYTVRWHRTSKQWVLHGGGTRIMFPGKVMAIEYAIRLCQELVKDGGAGGHIKVFTKAGDLELDRLLPKR